MESDGLLFETEPENFETGRFAIKVPLFDHRRKLEATAACYDLSRGKVSLLD